MITDTVLTTISNALGSGAMILIVIYHVCAAAFGTLHRFSPCRRCARWTTSRTTPRARSKIRSCVYFGHTRTAYDDRPHRFWAVGACRRAAPAHVNALSLRPPPAHATSPSPHRLWQSGASSTDIRPSYPHGSIGHCDVVYIQLMDDCPGPAPLRGRGDVCRSRLHVSVEICVRRRGLRGSSIPTPRDTMSGRFVRSSKYRYVARRG